jgi:hypothetical protein
VSLSAVPVAARRVRAATGTAESEPGVRDMPDTLPVRV